VGHRAPAISSTFGAGTHAAHPNRDVAPNLRKRPIVTAANAFSRRAGTRGSTEPIGEIGHALIDGWRNRMRTGDAAPGLPFVRSDGSTPRAEPPKALAKDGVMRPVPEPRSSQTSGRVSGRWRTNASIHVWIASGDICRPGRRRRAGAS